jgi:hypothetical protein
MINKINTFIVLRDLSLNNYLIVRLHDYQLSAELHSGYKQYDTVSLLEPLTLNFELLTQIYLKYHGFRFASVFIDYEFDLHLSFQEQTGDSENPVISHSVLLKKPVHITDIRFTLIPELIWAFDNYNIERGEFILPKIRNIHKKLMNED